MAYLGMDRSGGESVESVTGTYTANTTFNQLGSAIYSAVNFNKLSQNSILKISWADSQRAFEVYFNANYKTNYNSGDKELAFCYSKTNSDKGIDLIAFDVNGYNNGSRCVRTRFLLSGETATTSIATWTNEKVGEKLFTTGGSTFTWELFY